MVVIDTDTLEERVAAIRQFNRFFTRQIGVLREGLLHSPYSLTESRILYELLQYPQSGPHNGESDVQPPDSLQPQRGYATNPKISSRLASGPRKMLTSSDLYRELGLDA